MGPNLAREGGQDDPLEGRVRDRREGGAPGHDGGDQAEPAAYLRHARRIANLPMVRNGKVNARKANTAITATEVRTDAMNMYVVKIVQPRRYSPRHG
jgi:hypothetical protein